MTKKRRIVNTIFGTFAIVAIMAIAVGGLFIAGIAVGAECALADQSTPTVGDTFVFNGNLFASTNSQRLAISAFNNGISASFVSGNYTYSFAVGRLYAYRSGDFGYLLFNDSNDSTICSVYIVSGAWQRLVYGGNTYTLWSHLQFSIGGSIAFFYQDVWDSTYSVCFSYQNPLPDSETLSSGWHINSFASFGNIDISDGDENNLYSLDFSSLERFKFVYDNVAYACPYAIYAYATFNNRDGIVYVFANNLGNATQGVSFCLIPAQNQYEVNKAYIYIGIDYPSDLADWIDLSLLQTRVYLYNSAALTSSAQTSDEIIAFNVFASFWEDTVIVGDVTYTADTDPRALVLHELPWDLYSVSFSNAINSIWYPATASYDTIEIQCAYRQDANTWQDWYDSEFFNISEYVAIMPTIASHVGATDIFYPVFKYRYRGRVSVNGTYYYSNWHEIDPTVYQPNYDVMKSIYDSGFDYGEHVGQEEGYVNGINDANEYNFIVMALDIVRLPFDITFGTWHDDDPVTVDVDESGYRGGLFTFTLFGQDLRTFVLTLVSLCVIVRIVSFILTSKATEA